MIHLEYAPPNVLIRNGDLWQAQPAAVLWQYALPRRSAVHIHIQEKERGVLSIMRFVQKAAFLLAWIFCSAVLTISCSPSEVPQGDPGTVSMPPISPMTPATATADAASEIPEPTPTEVPLPSTEEVIDDMKSVDILQYIPEDTYAAEEGQRWYEPVVNNEELTLSLPDRYSEWLNAAADNLSYEGVTRIETDFEAPAWPMLAAIAANYRGDPDGMRTALVMAGGISTSIENAEDGTVLTISAHPADPNTLFYSLPESPVTNAFSLVVSYAYLATVFDNSLQGQNGIGEPELEQLLFPIARPANYYVGDCWYQARDKGARKHTGTDINAPEGTDLLACVDGTIIANGTDRVAGNYIVLRGRDGTQYHYYHMVELSDVPVGTEVRTGDVIGHVGCTGNSRANHLHFAIITSGGQYVNPVTYLQRAQKATIDGTIAPASVPAQ